MAKYQGACVTINNPSQQHKDILKPRARGLCLVRERLEKKKVRASIFSGDEAAPTTGTAHLQARRAIMHQMCL